MGKDRQSTRLELNDDRAAWRVVDDFPAEIAVSAAELDAVEAFLMPLVNAIMRGEPIDCPVREQDGREYPALAAGADSQTPQKAAPTLGQKNKRGGRRHAAFTPD